MRRLRLLAAILSAASLPAVFLAAKPAAAAPGGKVVVALKPDKSPDAMREEKARLAEWLGRRLGRPVEVVVPLSSAVIQEGLAGGSVDVAWLSSTDMWIARRKGAASVLLAGEIDGKTSYESWWVCLKGKPYASVADLAGKPVAFASRTSTSGFLVPVSDLVDRGALAAGADPEAFFGKGNVFWGTGYVSGVERVLSGQAEAAAVSDYVLAEDKHLSAGQRARLRKLQAQGPVPTHVLAVRAGLPAAEREALRAAILSMSSAEEVALRDRVFGSPLRAVSEDAHLAPVGKALRAAGKE